MEPATKPYLHLDGEQMSKEEFLKAFGISEEEVRKD